MARTPPSEPAKKSPARSPRPRELREVLRSPGHPIDFGLRRELESKLGHDFSGVRVHHDRDAAAMAELLGADAVTVGQDIFFGRGMFRPETPDGRRLLVHELLHTAQVPWSPGAVVAGRDAGAVSMPGEPLEREAERIARSDAAASPVARVAQGAAWLRYATVDADRMRTEQLDPATLVDRLVAGVLRSLRGDPTDSSRRVRAQLARFTPELRETVLVRLERRLPSSEYARVLSLLEEATTAPGPVETPNVPEPVPAPEPPEPEPSEPRPSEPEPSEPEPSEPEPDEPAPEEPGPEEPAPEEPGEEPAPGEEKPEKEEEKKKEEKDKKGEKKDGEEKPAEERPPAEEAPAAETAAARQPGAPGAQPPAGQGPAAGATPAPEGASVVQQPGEVAPERVEEAAAAPDSPLVRHGLLRPETDDRLEEQERPIGLDPSAEAEVPVPEPEESAAEDEERPAPELKPEDHLPAADMDVSNVPTADQIRLPATGAPPPQQEAPSFPSPPPTKAEQAEEQESAEEAPEPAPTAPAAGAEPGAPAQPAAAETEEQPPADQPLDAEVGPEPTAEAPTAAPQTGEPAGADTGREEFEPTTAGPPETGATDLAGPGPETGPGPGADAGPGAGPGVAAGPGAGPGVVPDAAGGAPGPADLTGPEAGPAGEGDLGAGPAPDASLEPGGGGCDGAPVPAEPQGGGGACGGGGAAPAGAGEQEQQPPAPDLSNQPPEAALATVATLPPDRMQSSLSDVDAAASKDVAKEQEALQATPPTTERPAGAPQILTGPPEAAPPGDPVQVELTKAEATRAEEQKKAEAKRVEGENQAHQAPRPHVTGTPEGQLSQEDVENVQQAVNSVPTTDPALNTTVGPAQKVELTGEQDPARTDEQATELQQASTTLHTHGREEAAKPLGENQIFPNAPPETLTAEVPSPEGGSGGPAQAAGGADQGVAVVAQQERGAEIQAGVAQGQTQMGTERQAKQQGEAQSRADHEAEMAQQVQENGAAQTEERGKVAADVRAQREEWRTEQDKKIEESSTAAGKEHETARTGIHKEKEDTDKEAQDRKQEDDAKIRQEREQAEEKARKEKEAKKRESEGGGFFSWVASKVTSFFEGLLNAITAIFDLAIKAVNSIIQTFASVITTLIDLARDAIVGLINALADALLKLCDVLAVFFPELAARLREKIENLRDAAIAAVNKLADALKSAVKFLLDKLAQALTAWLRLLEKGLKAAVGLVRAAVNAAIEYAKAAIQMLGELAAIIADIASMGVGAWLGRLGSSAVEGIRNHLWDAIKSAVRKWFDEKVQAIVGLGKMVIDVLIKGCISMAKIGKMVWDAIIAALPMMIVMIVIERLVSLIVPAAGAVLAVVQGLMAAWGTISKIIAAIGAFIAFVKAVKAGPAACLFAAAVAAGVVALLEFITNFLMAKLAGAAKGAGNALKGMAKKIMNGLKRAGKGARKAAGKATNAARRGAQRAANAFRRPGRRRPGSGRPGSGRTGPGRPARPGRPVRPDRRPARPSPRSRANQAKKAVANGIKKVGTALRRVGKKLANSKLGQALKNTAKKLRDKYKNFRDRLNTKAKQRQDNKKTRDDKKAKADDKNARLQRAVARIKPRVESMLKRGVRGVALKAALFSMRAWYRLTSLTKQGNSPFTILARLNPDADVGNGFVVDRDRLLKFLRDLGTEIVEKSKAQAARISEGKREGTVDPKTKKPREIAEYSVPEGVNLPAVLARATEMKHRGWGKKEVLSFLQAQAEQAESAGQATNKPSALGATGAEALEVARQQKAGKLRNKIVMMLQEGKEIRTGLAYKEIAESVGQQGKAAGKALGEDLAKFAAGGRPTGPNRGMTAFLGTLMVVQEGHRSSGSVVSSGMVIQMMKEGRDFGDTLMKLPMAMDRAQKASDDVEKYLNRTPEERKRYDLTTDAKVLVEREIVLIRAWIETLGIHASKASAKSVEEQLFEHIRKRMYDLYFRQNRAAQAQPE